jgi:hypothetical protein
MSAATASHNEIGGTEVTSVGRSAQALPKLAWRDAGKLAEPSGEMRLVAESHRGADFPEGSISRPQEMLSAVDA